MKTIFRAFLILALVAFAARAQDEVAPPAPGYQPFTTAQLAQLVGPVALYPDPLLSIILPASTFPTEIVLADRYISGGGDPNQVDQQPWDPSVQALAHYPQVLSWMDNNLNWTTQLGEAFENQQQDVMDAVQSLRTDAYNLGNLQSTPQQQVTDDNGDIEIVPVNPDDVYLPQYEPDQAFYQTPYGTPFVTFGIGYPIGPWLCCGFDWGNHNLFYWNSNYPRPSDWWHENSGQRSAYFAGHPAPAWHSSRPAYSGAYQGGDRGWNNQAAWTAPAVNRTAPAFNRPAATPSPAPAENFDNYQRPQDNAFIGIQSAPEARAFSDRGQQSMRTMPSNFGGGFHGGGGGGGRR